MARPSANAGSKPSAVPAKKPVSTSSQSGVLATRKPTVPTAKTGPLSAPQIPIDDDEILELALAEERSAKKPVTKTSIPVVTPKPTAPGIKPKAPTVKGPPMPPSLGDKAKKSTLKKGDLADSGEDEFFKLSD